MAPPNKPNILIIFRRNFGPRGVLHSKANADGALVGRFLQTMVDSLPRDP
jgi:hypothetical protein